MQKNRTGFVVALGGGRLPGYADVWELRADFYVGLRIGAVDEESIAAPSILGRSDPRSSRWYIGSPITEPKLRANRPAENAIIFSSICNALPQFFEDHGEFPARILGVESSRFGKKLLLTWGFDSVMGESGAIDSRPRFEKTMAVAQDSNTLYVGRGRV